GHDRVEVGVGELDRLARQQGLSAFAAHRVVGEAVVGDAVGGGAVRAGDVHGGGSRLFLFEAGSRRARFQGAALSSRATASPKTCMKAWMRAVRRRSGWVRIHRGVSRSSIGPDTATRSAS